MIVVSNLGQHSLNQPILGQCSISFPLEKSKKSFAFLTLSGGIEMEIELKWVLLG